MMEEQGNPFVDPPDYADPTPAPRVGPSPAARRADYTGLTSQQLMEKEKDLDRREHDLQRREQQLEYKERKVGELQLRLEELDKPPNWPSCKPIIRLSIREDIPEKSRFMAKRAYFAWWMCTFCYLFNVIAVMALIIVDTDRGTDFGVGLAVGIIGPPVAFVFWFRPMYAALRRGKAFPYIIFIFCYFCHLICVLIYTIGIPNSGGAGYFLAFEYMSKSKGKDDSSSGDNGSTSGFKAAGVICLISAIFWTSQLVFGCFLMLSAVRFYRSSGYSAEKAVTEVAQSDVVKSATKVVAENATQASVTAATSAYSSDAHGGENNV